MNVKSCEKKEKNISELTVVVTAEEFDSALNEAYKKSRSQISVPGFRKGKAPRKIIENMYGASVFYNDALDIILPGVCSFGITEEKLRTVGYPQLVDVSFEDDKSAVVIYTVSLYPEITIGEYKGVEAVKQKAVVEDAAIDSEIEGVRLRNARIQEATRPAINGDTTIIDFDGYLDGVPFDGGHGEDYELVLGSNSFIPGFEAQMQGMRVDEERDLNLTFPAEYQAKELAGKDVVFHVKLKELKEKVLPDLDDEFVKDVSEFDTVAEYKESIRTRLLAEKEKEVANAFETAVVAKIIETMEGDVPDAMIEEYMDSSMQSFSQQLSQYGMELPMYVNMMGTTMDAFRESTRPSAVQSVNTMLVLEKVAELEKIEATDEEVEANYAELAERYGVEADVVKSSFEREAIERDIKLKKASAIVTEAAVAVDAPEETKEEAKAPKAKAAPKTKKAAADKADSAEAAPTKKPAAKKTTKTAEAKTDKAEKAEKAEKPAAAKKTTTKAAAEKKPAAKTAAKKTTKTEDKAE